MTASVVLFEDEGAGRFEPVALTRSVARLRLGAFTHAERWHRFFPDAAFQLVCREYLTRTEQTTGAWTAVNHPPADGDVRFIAAALGRPGLELEAAIREMESGTALLAGDRLAAARATGEAAERLAGSLRDLAGTGPRAMTRADWPRLAEAAGLAVRDVPAAVMPETLVDLVAGNAEAIEDDFALLSGEMAPPDPGAFPGVHLMAPERIRLGEGVRIDPGCVLDAREGSIVLGPGTRVGPNAVLVGPLVTGRDCRINPAARILEGVSLGPVCKVGGEVDATIVQGWSNKQHDGFLGHSYLGCWVNLGAATDTSDLKNDYGPVRLVIAGEETDTGRRSVGSLIGDHSKTAIHTRLNTGTVIGVSSNLFAADFPEKEVPSFCWGGGAARAEYRLGKAVRVASTVMSRRGVEFGAADEWLFAQLHQATEVRRQRWVGGN